MMFTAQATVKNRAGIHVRPSTHIMNEIKEYGGSITVSAKGMDVDLCGPLAAIGLLSLGLKKGDTLTIKIEGPDERQTGEKMVGLFEYEYDFPEKE